MRRRKHPTSEQREAGSLPALTPNPPVTKHSLVERQNIMAWSWSHSDEALENAYQNCCNLPREALLTTFVEWRVWSAKQNDEDERDAELKAQQMAEKLPNETLADVVWEFASMQQTCDNGGHNAWIDPEGFQTVPFDLVSTDR